MLKKFLILFLTLTFILATTTSVQASELNINHMEIDIWPEYDRPAVLVIFHISFSFNIKFTRPRQSPHPGICR